MAAVDNQRKLSPVDIAIQQAQFGAKAHRLLANIYSDRNVPLSVARDLEKQVLAVQAEGRRLLLQIT